VLAPWPAVVILQRGNPKGEDDGDVEMLDYL
jgi:hypothetical protein